MEAAGRTGIGGRVEGVWSLGLEADGGTAAELATSCNGTMTGTRLRKTMDGRGGIGMVLGRGLWWGGRWVVRLCRVG